jgi:hypothetical protein
VRNVDNTRPAVNSPVPRRSNAHATKVTGTRKLPSRTRVGIRLGLPVRKMTTTVTTQSASPTRKMRSHIRCVRRGALSRSRTTSTTTDLLLAAKYSKVTRNPVGWGV